MFIEDQSKLPLSSVGRQASDDMTGTQRHAGNSPKPNWRMAEAGSSRDPDRNDEHLKVVEVKTPSSCLTANKKRFTLLITVTGIGRLALSWRHRTWRCFNCCCTSRRERDW
ncbi:hypothetical protein HN51_040796 [Arachis hypogaea]|nr:uncharacterized protein DS421_16g546500 [Arachis hypogaea]